MSPQVTAAIIAGSVGVLTVIATVVTQYLGRRATSRDTQKALEEQGKQLDRTLEEQGKQLDRTLEEQHTRTLNELYTQAVEQLGNDKAPVRLGGLYALERLAQDNPAHRQTIVNNICAYLRMPFSSTRPSGPEATATWEQERQVRVTAQRILGEHLRDERTEDKRSTEPPSPRFWNDIRLDLVGATLIDFDIRNGVTPDADFRGATFSDDAWFSGATFSGAAWFSGATFSDDAWFNDATFHDDAHFGATFSGTAWFGGATFSDDADFQEATFGGGAWFSGATFSSGAWFTGATFSGGAIFDEATFSDASSLLSFERSRVLSPSARHSWPTGWRLGPDGSGGYTVVRANDSGGS